MNKLLSAMLLNTLKLITGGELMDHIVGLVTTASSLETSGEEKRKSVMAALGTVGADLQPIVAATAGYVLNLAVEAAVAYVKVHSEK